MQRLLAFLWLALGLASCGGTGTAVILDSTGEMPGDTYDSRGTEDLVPTPDAALPELVDLADEGLDLAEIGELPPLDLPPDPGGFGYPCQTDSQCNSGLCVMTPDGKQCTIPCQDECPPGWACGLHKPSLPDEVYVCVPLSMSLCRPCADHADCHLNGVDLGETCAPYGPGGSFCATPCGDEGECPDGYLCVDGGCRLAEGECGCAQWFIDEGASTACFVENDEGTCHGTRTCGDEGLSPCDAPVPTAELCNLVDDDCDGALDEGTGGAACAIDNSNGSCPGVELCDDGALICEGPVPEPEACDGKDNDCDGETDEGFPDTDDDGVADCMETDKDGDGVVDGLDNCPAVPNEGQEDFDLDGNGDACDLDDDNDLVADGDDCEPKNPKIHPGADEVCDGKDNDCSGVADDGFADLSCGQGECFHTVPACVGGVPQACNPFEGAAAESCDGKDNDCDGLVDEDLGETTCGLGECLHTVPKCIEGVPQICDPKEGASPQEECDGKDNDCDGLIDEGLGSTTCGLGQCVHTVANCVEGVAQECDPLEGASPQEECDGKDNDCDGATDEGLGETTCGKGECVHTVANCVEGEAQLCDPLAGATNEVCDGKDYDCDGATDEELGETTCGKGECVHTVANCVEGQLQECDPLEGASPEEECNGKDDDCDGATDEDLGQLACGLGECFHVIQACADGQPQECDPLEGASPQEECDGKDNDCDGATDEELGETTCGEGECVHTVANCQDGLPVLCDPLEGAVDEVCNGKDDDCDGQTDEGFPDTDGDGVLDCLDGDDDNDGVADTQDDDPLDPWVCRDVDMDDCDDCAVGVDGFGPEADNDPVNDGADLDGDGICDLGDDDTDGDGCPDAIDENPLLVGPDTDGDGMDDDCDPDDDDDGDPDETDCAPLDGSIGHGLAEICFNEVDDNCDGVQDDVCVGSTCKALLQDYPGLPSGVYAVDPDGAGGTAPFDAWCDMTTDGGGWTMVAWYSSNKELHVFDPNKHQVQSDDNGATVASPPEIWKDGVWGHVAFPLFGISGHDFKLECRNSPTANWFSHVRNDLFSDWSNGDKGSYGSGSGWGVFRWLNGRSSHWVCGHIVGSTYQGIAYCKGPGSGGSWGNHVVSISFDPEHNYGGGTAIGCNGTGIDHGKNGQWQGRVWIR
jgi:hypothetical protein